MGQLVRLFKNTPGQLPGKKKTTHYLPRNHQNVSWKLVDTMLHTLSSGEISVKNRIPKNLDGIWRKMTLFPVGISLDLFQATIH